ncbi:MAG: HD domain-containing protein [Dehalococcoidia bacterium]|nr:HD domain-containing protein [Dehalococcoidia bacterium]
MSFTGLFKKMFFSATQLVIKLQGVFAGIGVQAYLVGGYLRDGLVSRDNEDIDLAVSGDAEVVAQALVEELGGSYFHLGHGDGIVRIIIYQDDISLQIDIAQLRGRIEDDLLLRDFTLDALALPIEAFDGKWDPSSLIDPTGGYKDLKNKVLRAAGPTVFLDDPLRLLRGPRLAAEIGLTIEETTDAEIRACAHLLPRASGERIRDEFCKILEAPNPGASIRTLDRLGLLQVFLPEVAALIDVDQPKEHYWDVFDHSVETVAALDRFFQEGDFFTPLGWEGSTLGLPWEPRIEEHFLGEVGDLPRTTLVKIAGLFHDLAKPATKSYDDTGRMRFFRHAETGAEMSKAIMERLHFGSAAILMVSKMVEEHLRPGQWNAGDLPTSRSIYRYLRDLGPVAIDTIYLNLADHIAARGPMLLKESWKQHIAGVKYVLERYYEQLEKVSRPRLITGHDIIARFNLKPGPEIGEMLDAVEEAQASDEISTIDQAFEYIEKRFLVKS